MSGAEPTRRSSHVEMPAAYAAVGASKLPDLLRFPPEGSTPYEESLQLGSGQDRFIAASSLLMTWGAQRGTGIAVTHVSRGTDAEYVGPEFDEQGRAQAVSEIEEQFGPDGEPYLVAGTTAVLAAPGKPERSILVVYTVTEERVVGFAWGTSDELGAVGEQRFTVEFREDDTVWAVARGFLTSPKNGLLGLKARAVIREAIDAARDQLAALAPGAAPVPPAAEEPAIEEPDGEESTAEQVTVDDSVDVPVVEQPEAETSEIEETELEDPEEGPEAEDPEEGPEAEVPASAASDVADTPDPADPADAPDTRATHQRRPSRPQP